MLSPHPETRSPARTEPGLVQFFLPAPAGLPGAQLRLISHRLSAGFPSPAADYTEEALNLIQEAIVAAGDVPGQDVLLAWLQAAGVTLAGGVTAQLELPGF